MIEYGLFKIRSLLGNFLNHDGQMQRCGCPLPCRPRKEISLTKYPVKHRNDSKSFILFQFEPLVKRYTYHILYSGSNLIADIGGYLGLFLGLSVFGIVEIFSKLVQDENPRRAIQLAKNTANILKESIKL